MITIKDIDNYISAFAARELSEPWDNDGIMFCKNPDNEVKKTVVCLEINTDAVKYAAEIGAELIITHHPFIFRPMPNIKGEKFSEIELLMKNGISVLSYHTRFDKAKNGVNDILAETLGLTSITDNGTFLRVGELDKEMTGSEFADYLRIKLDCGTMKTYFEKNAKIKKVSVCGGAGKDFLAEAATVSDAYVSADFSHETFREAKTSGIAVFDAGHYHTENPAAKKLCERLQTEFPYVAFSFYDVGSPFFTV